MLKNFSWNVWPPNNAAALLRLGVGVLLAANLVAGYFVLRPIGGSPDELRQQALEMRTQIHQQQNALDRTRLLSGKVEIGRGEGDGFMTQILSASPHGVFGNPVGIEPDRERCQSHAQRGRVLVDAGRRQRQSRNDADHG